MRNWLNWVRSVHVLCWGGVMMFIRCGRDAKVHTAAQRMRQLVVDIARSARAVHPNFLVITQNGEELVFEDLDTAGGWAQPYFNSLSAVGAEEVTYSGTYHPRTERLAALRQIRPHKPVFVSEYIANGDWKREVLRRCSNEGFVCFVRMPSNYYYTSIPDSIPYENTQDIRELSQVRNYLYLISYDSFSGRSELLDRLRQTNFDLIIMDAFWQDSLFSAQEIASLRRKANGGNRLVVAYCNIGAAEKWRYYWQDEWKIGHPKWLKKSYEGYPDEIWVEYWHEDWQRILWKGEDSYLQKIIRAGFDGAYLDNLEAYYFLYH